MAHCEPVSTSAIQTATATLHTNRGDIKIALFGNHAPKTVANFVGLAQGTKDYSTQNATGSATSQARFGYAAVVAVTFVARVRAYSSGG